MAQEEEYQIPIFLINGQLDSGKTRFIQDTIAMDSLQKLRISFLLYAKRVKKNIVRSF